MRKQKNIKEDAMKVRPRLYFSNNKQLYLAIFSISFLVVCLVATLKHILKEAAVFCLNVTSAFFSMKNIVIAMVHLVHVYQP